MVDSDPRGSSLRLGGAVSGFGLPLQGLRLLLRERGLWAPAAVPFALSLLFLVLAVLGLVHYAGLIWEGVRGSLPTPVADAWFEWLWVGPAWLGVQLLACLLFGLVAGVLLAASYLLAGLVASPFHDLLARRVEALVAGRAEDLSAQGVSGALVEGLRATRQEAVRLAFFLAIQLGILLLGVVIPGGQLLAPPAMTLLTVLFLPLDYASYTLDRRLLSFGEKRHWLSTHRASTLGFGGAAFLLCLVPLLNLLAMPVLVVAGTLLVLRHPPAPAARAPHGDPGAPA